jgi:GntR family transcriptional regulator
VEHTWNDALPIYRQLMNEIIGWILRGELQDGDPLPSIRAIASRFRVNPLTVSKACQGLTFNRIVDKQRGVGFFVRRGARKMLLRSEKEKFLQEELPELLKRIKQLGISHRELLAALENADDSLVADAGLEPGTGAGPKDLLA